MPHSVNSEENEPKGSNNSKAEEDQLYRLVSTLISNYNGYFQVETQIEAKFETEQSNQILNIDEDNDNEDNELKSLNLVKAELFNSFILSFDELTLHSRTFKMNCFQWLKNVLTINKLIIIQLYEFINKLLKIQITSSAKQINFNYNGEEISNLESKIITVQLALQLLHILTTSDFMIFYIQLLV